MKISLTYEETVDDILEAIMYDTSFNEKIAKEIIMKIDKRMASLDFTEDVIGTLQISLVIGTLQISLEKDREK